MSGAVGVGETSGHAVLLLDKSGAAQIRGS